MENSAGMHFAEVIINPNAGVVDAFAYQLNTEIVNTIEKIQILRACKPMNDELVVEEIGKLQGSKLNYHTLTGQEWTSQCYRKDDEQQVSVTCLNDQILEKISAIATLKGLNATVEVIDQEIKRVLDLKSKYKNVTGTDWTSAYTHGVTEKCINSKTHADEDEVYNVNAVQASEVSTYYEHLCMVTQLLYLSKLNCFSSNIVLNCRHYV